MHKEYAIFDLDGTLVDSMKYWKNLGREYLELKGIEEGIEEALDEIKTMTLKEAAKLFLERFSLGETLVDVVAEINALMGVHYRENIPLKEGAKEYLVSLQEKGVHMCVASATDGPLIDACLQRLQVAEYFEFQLSCETIGVGKDKPDIYEMAAERFQVEHGEIAVFEDALYALETAKKAGFHTVLVYDKQSEAEWNKGKDIADETRKTWKIQ